MHNDKNGILFLCSTPIGNLEDITLRVLRVLKEVDLIAAEDTRRTVKLLNHYGISKPLTSYHEHNRREKGEVLLDKLKDGENIALVSDAGMPGISDPGAELAGEAAKVGINVTVLPGPSASLAALVLSGLSTQRFVFEGFLPKKNKERIERINRLRQEDRTIILYEAPHRLVGLFTLLHQILGNRRITITRELTKIHEEVIMTDISGALSHYSGRQPRGEYVLILEGRRIEDEYMDFSKLSIKEHIQSYIRDGMSKKDAIKQVSRDRGIPKNQVYKYSLDI